MSSNKSINWLIVLTPLQLRNTLTVLGIEEIDTIFYTENVKLSEISSSLSKAKLVKIPDNVFRKSDLIRVPFRSLIVYRKLINQFVTIAEQYSIALGKKVNLYCGSDKNLYVQLLALKIKEQGKLSMLISVDEGAGHYCKERPYWRIKDCLYRILSPLLLGVPYDYVDVMGTWKNTNQVWVRWPERLGYCAKDKEYKKIYKQVSQHSLLNNSDGKKALVLSSPLATDRFMSEKDEEKLLQNIIQNLKLKGYDIVLKPHPRDTEQKFLPFLKDSYVSMLNGNELAENLPYGEYKLVINFGSSVVMDMLNAGFPPDRIITVDVIGVIKRVPLFNTTKVCTSNKDVALLFDKE